MNILALMGANKANGKKGASKLPIVPGAADQWKEALNLAYPLAIESYKEAERRMDVVEKRVQDLLAFAVSVTLAGIALYSSKFNLQNVWFVGAIALFATGLAVGAYARLCGSLWQISLNHIFDEFLIFPDSQFKLSMVENAGIHSSENAITVGRKATLTNLSVFIFVLEIGFLVAACLSQPTSLTHPTAEPIRAQVSVERAAARKAPLKKAPQMTPH